MDRSIIPGTNSTFKARFWGKVDIRAHGECWPWTGARDRGYGMIGLGGRNAGTMRAHRAAVLISGRSIPKGMLVRHICNVRECCNPDHLVVGTYAENAEDARKAGTLAVGDRLPQTRLNPSKVNEIRELLEGGKYTQRKIATMFGVGQYAISQINTGATWKHVEFAVESGIGNNWTEV